MDASIDVACLFSGGVDSSLILSNARTINEDICAVTANFGQDDDAESRSRSLAEKLGHRNHLIRNISKEDVDDSLRITSKICESPFDDTSIIPSNIAHGWANISLYQKNSPLFSILQQDQLKSLNPLLAFTAIIAPLAAGLIYVSSLNTKVYS